METNPEKIDDSKAQQPRAVVSTALLDDLVSDYEKGGSVRMDKSLGFQRMPEGYALMLNADHTHFYWLRFDGQEGCIDWNKWRARKGAIIHSSNV